jgi:hypothetical protein
MGEVATTFTGKVGIDFEIIQRYPPIILSKTNQFSVEITKDKVLVKRLKFKIGSTLKGVDTSLSDESLDVRLSWEPHDSLISTEDFGDTSKFNFP